jgi:hypothetical protein
MMRKFSQGAYMRHHLLVVVHVKELAHHFRHVDRHHVLRLPISICDWKAAPGDLNFIPHLFVIVPQIQ